MGDRVVHCLEVGLACNEVGSALRADLAALSLRFASSLASGRVGTAYQPSAPWGLTSFGILNVSDPVGALCLSRAPPALRTP